MHSREEPADGFRLLGLEPGDVVMVHASVRSVGEIAGGPDQIHLAIKDAITDTGTLVMYASCPEYYDEVGRGVHPGPRRKATPARVDSYLQFSLSRVTGELIAL